MIRNTFGINPLVTPATFCIGVGERISSSVRRSPSFVAKDEDVAMDKTSDVGEIGDGFCVGEGVGEEVGLGVLVGKGVAVGIGVFVGVGVGVGVTIETIIELLSASVAFVVPPPVYRRIRILYVPVPS